MIDRRPGLVTLATAACTLLLAAGSALGEGITVELTPTWQQVEAGTQFELDLTISQAGPQFNAFSALIGYDPAALTLLPLDPLGLQEGSLLLEACESTFHRFREGADRDTIVDALLCAGVVVTGPGQIYHLRFQATGEAQQTQVRFLSAPRFSDAGSYVTPVQSSDAVVEILPSPAGIGRVARPIHLEVRAAPNPGRDQIVLTVKTDRTGPRHLEVLDLQGRVVRRFDAIGVADGAGKLLWDGRDFEGKSLPSGIYVVRLEMAGCAASNRVLLIR